MATSAASSDCGLPRHPFNLLADVPDQGWLAHILRRPDPRAASAVLERTLARLAPRVPSQSDVAGIYRHFRISPDCARPLSIALWARMLQHCQRNGARSGEGLRYLNALRVALELRESDVDGLRESEIPSTQRIAVSERATDSAVAMRRTPNAR
jgi:hypothetical protein